jgi:hypothetical protein
MLVLAHVTHEAVDKMGGIGTVLEGLITAPAYARTVQRTILIGPLFSRTGDPQRRLGEKGRVLYSSFDGIDGGGYAGRFRPVELAFGVGIVYGRRILEDPLGGNAVDVEVVLLDVADIDLGRMNAFKARLYERFGLHSMRYEYNWDFEQYMRLAEPGYYALHALLHEPQIECVVISHEYMGMPFVLQTVLEGDRRFRTMYYAHETPTVRRLVEDHPGHDTCFYNVLSFARAQGLRLEEVFGPQDSYYKHALLMGSRRCDVVLAVGDYVRRELSFIDEQAFNGGHVRLCYNGVPARKCDLEARRRSKELLVEYTRRVLGFAPNYVMTHVTRPVISKGLWRDLLVLHHLEPLLAAEGRRAVLYILTTAGGVRRNHDVRNMERNYGWPAAHREGYPDLVGPEVSIAADCTAFNAGHNAVKAVLVNQFGWSRPACGDRMPAETTFLDLRRGADVEFGQSTYEPFGISPVEGLCFGAVCVVSNVSGCVGFVQRAARGETVANMLSADYTALSGGDTNLGRLLKIGRTERDAVEARVGRQTALELFQRLPRTDADVARLLETGYHLACRMGWDVVFNEFFEPALQQALAKGPGA